MKRVIFWVLLAALIVAHQDWWWWHSFQPLLFGFIPASLWWHASISICAALLGVYAVVFLWPSDLEALEPSAKPTDAASPRRGSH